MPKKVTAASWKTKPMPKAQKELSLSGVYTEAEYEQISLGSLPQSQADKWFIYLADEWLCFHRSWTGTCVFKLQIMLGNCKYHVTKAIVNCDPEQYRSTSDQQDVQLIAYLIDQLLLNRFAPLPTPQNMSAENTQRHQKHVMGTEDVNEVICLQVKQNGGRKRP